MKRKNDDTKKGEKLPSFQGDTQAYYIGRSAIARRLGMRRITFELNMAYRHGHLPVYRSLVVAVGPEHHTQVLTEKLAVAWLNWRKSVRKKGAAARP